MTPSDGSLGGRGRPVPKSLQESRDRIFRIIKRNTVSGWVYLPFTQYRIPYHWPSVFMGIGVCALLQAVYQVVAILLVR